MEKSVLISIRPEWCELIANGKKTIEVRKTRPKLEPPFRCYIYCTEKGDYLTSVNGVVQPVNQTTLDLKRDNVLCILNGTVIGEFVCDKISTIAYVCADDVGYRAFEFNPSYPYGSDGLTGGELERYLCKGKTLQQGLNVVGYGWHISGVRIYDIPKRLSEFSQTCNFKNDDGTCQHRKVGCSYQYADYNPDGSLNLVECMRRISRPPQSWRYVVNEGEVPK